MISKMLHTEHVDTLDSSKSSLALDPCAQFVVNIKNVWHIKLVSARPRIRSAFSRVDGIRVPASRRGSSGNKNRGSSSSESFHDRGF